MFAYRMRSTRHSSVKFGPCECCDRHATEVFVMTEFEAVPYLINLGSTETDPSRDDYSHVRMMWGHRECLIGQQQLGA